MSEEGVSEGTLGGRAEGLRPWPLLFSSASYSRSEVFVWKLGCSVSRDEPRWHLFCLRAMSARAADVSISTNGVCKHITVALLSYA
jgi:hypothetical protein